MNTKKYAFLCILMALAVITSSTAWTPAPALQDDPNPDDPSQSIDWERDSSGKKQKLPGNWSGTWPNWPPQYTHGRLTARIVGDLLYVYGERFPRRHDFFLKVRRNSNYTWERLGVVSSDGNGNIEDRFRLPKELRKAYSVNVCLKDVVSDKAYCITARR